MKLTMSLATVLLLTLPLHAHAADQKRSFAAGHFAGELNSKAEGMVKPVEPATNEGLSIDDAATRTMMESSKDSREDLRDTMQQVKDQNARKEALRDNRVQRLSQPQIAKPTQTCAHPPCGLGEAAANQGKKVQATMGRMEKSDRAASGLMKKNSDTASGVIGNMK